MREYHGMNFMGGCGGGAPPPPKCTTQPGINSITPNVFLSAGGEAFTVSCSQMFNASSPSVKICGIPATNIAVNAAGTVVTGISGRIPENFNVVTTTGLTLTNTCGSSFIPSAASYVWTTSSNRNCSIWVKQ